MCLLRLAISTRVLGGGAENAAAENVGPENEGPNTGLENAGPSRNAASLRCVCMVKWTVTSSKGIGVMLCSLLAVLIFFKCEYITQASVVHYHANCPWRLHSVHYD